MRIFVSHIREEFQIALLLKKWIESAFTDHCEVWVHSDPEDIPEVAQYLERNEKAWEELKALILLCSPDSIQRPWLSFQAGCAWIRKILIIPVCYSGLSRKDLPPPLAAFPGYDLNQRDFGQKLFMTLAKELGIAELPSVPYRQMRQEINQMQESLPGGETGSPGPERAADPALEPLHVEILLVLRDSYGYTSAVLAEHFKTAEKKILPLLKRLVGGSFVYASPAGMGHVRYNLTQKGKNYLEQSGLT